MRAHTPPGSLTVTSATVNTVHTLTKRTYVDLLRTASAACR